MIGETCAVHKHRSAVFTEQHHVWPKGNGGPDIASNRIPVCADGHYMIHAYIRLLHAGGGKVPFLTKRRFGPKVRAYAKAGYDQIVSKGHW